MVDHSNFTRHKPHQLVPSRFDWKMFKIKIYHFSRFINYLNIFIRYLLTCTNGKWPEFEKFKNRCVGPLRGRSAKFSYTQWPISGRDPGQSLSLDLRL